MQEVSVLSYFSQNRLFTTIIGFSRNPNTIVMRMYRFGSVEDILSGASQHAEWSLQLMRSLYMDLVEALSEMHQAGMLHADVKPANVLLDVNDDGESFHAVLSDFGISQIVTKQALLVSGFQVSKLQGASISYSAPELLVRFANPNMAVPTVAPQNKLKLDVFAAAVVGFEMLTRMPAWGDMSDQDVMKVVLNGGRPRFPPPFMSQCQRDRQLATACEVIQRGWAMRVEERLTMAEMLNLLRQ